MACLHSRSMTQCGELFLRKGVNSRDRITQYKHHHHDSEKNNDSNHEQQDTNDAQKHYDNARDALIDAIGHSAAAGATIEIPPLAIYEAYQAIEAWKTMGSEYDQGLECEKNAQENHENQGESND